VERRRLSVEEIRKMLELGLDKIRSVLCLGAHPDDIEIGCGGALLKLAQQNPSLKVDWVVFSGGRTRAREARCAARFFLQGLKNCSVSIAAFEDGFFPRDWDRIKRRLERVKRTCDPDLILSHYGQDRHQDHRVLSDLTWNTFRRHLILEYEIPKYDGDLGAPNVFVRLDEETCRTKTEAAFRFFESQRAKHWFAPETFMGLMRLRGMECASPTHHAEAFYCRKLVL
jgi:LmbE family N-acetylglucosaminyl deacetylase